MSLTPSTMQELGSIAPDFTLNDPDGRSFRLSKVEIDKGLLVIFMCNHCPYVIHIRQVLCDEIKKYQAQGIEVVAINSNDFKAYPDDAPENMSRDSKELGYTFPYLVDAKQEVAKAYRAACTPDFFVYDGDRKLVYRGQFDSARPGNDELITGNDLSGAIHNLVAGVEINAEQKASMGCNIKWQPGKEPDYF